MSSVKKQKDTALAEEPLRLAGVQHAAGQRLIAPERRKRRGQSGSDVVEVCLMVKVKADAVKSNIAQEPGSLGS